MPESEHTVYPVALTFRRYLTTRPGEDLTAVAAQLSAEFAATNVALAMARLGEHESVQPATHYERETTFREDYSDPVVFFPSHHAMNVFTDELGGAAWEAEVLWLSDEDPPDVIQITRTDDELPADSEAAREAIRGVCGCPLILEEIDSLDGQPDGRYATWLPEGFPSERVAYLDTEDWTVDVVSRGPRPGAAPSTDPTPGVDDDRRT